MNPRQSLSFALLALALVAGIQAQQVSNSTVEVVIAASDSMQFTVTHFEAHPGQPVHVVFKNQGTVPKEAMGHNWILLKGGVDVDAYAMDAIAAIKENFEPKSRAADVLVCTPLLGPKETSELTFNAPAAPGKYVYLCSFPGHCMAGMRGELIVK